MDRRLKQCLSLVCIICLVACEGQAPSELKPNASYQPEPEKFEQQFADEQTRAAQELGLTEANVVAVLEAFPFELEVAAVQLADPNVLVPLVGQVISADDTAQFKTQWRQISGPAAAILEPNNSSTQVLIPSVEETAQLIFRFSAADEQGRALSKTSQITAIPIEREFELTAAAESENGNLIFTLKLDAPATQTIELNYQTEDGTALADVDYTPVGGSLTFEVGDLEKQIAVEILDDDFIENAETLFLNVVSINSAINVNARALGVIQDNEVGEPINYEPPESIGLSDLTQADLEGEQGVLRYQLSWDNPNSSLALTVTDPCGNTLSANQISATCQESTGSYYSTNNEAGIAEENIIWQNNSPAGPFKTFISHLAGEPSDYWLRVFSGDESELFQGTIGGGEQVLVLEKELESFAQSSEPASSSSIPVSSSVSSSDEAISSSSVLSSSSSLTSSVSSSSVQSSTIVSSSSSSVSSVANESTTSSASESFFVDEVEVNDNLLLANRITLQTDELEPTVSTIAVRGSMGSAKTPATTSTFAENFNTDSFSKYQTLLVPNQTNAGSIEDFKLVEDEFSLALEVTPGPTSSHIAIAAPIPNPGALESLSLKFKLIERDDGGNGLITLRDADLNAVLAFSVSSDIDADPLQRTNISTIDQPGNSSNPFGPEGGVDLDTWYQLQVTFNHVNASLDVVVTNIASGDQFAKSSISLIGRSIVEHVVFENDNVVGAGTVRFDDVEIKTSTDNQVVANPASQDVFVFSAEADSTYSLHYTNVEGSLLGAVKVLDADGNIISSQSDGYDTMVTNIPVPADGDYYIQVTRALSSQSGIYQLVLVTKDGGNQESESNNGLGSANYLSPMTGSDNTQSTSERQGTITDGDSDYFFVYMLAGDQLTVDVAGLQSGVLKPNVAILDASNNVVVENTNVEGDTDITVTYTATSDAVYYILVSAAEGAGDFGFYLLNTTIKNGSKTTADLEPNNDNATGNRIELATDVENEGVAVGRAVGEFALNGDASADTYVFSAQAGSSYTLHYRNVHSSLLGAVNVLDADGNVISTQRDGYDTMVTNVLIPADGDYYIQVTRALSSQSGIYQLVLTVEGGNQ